MFVPLFLHYLCLPRIRKKFISICIIKRIKTLYKFTSIYLMLRCFPFYSSIVVVTLWVALTSRVHSRHRRDRKTQELQFTYEEKISPQKRKSRPCVLYFAPSKTNQVYCTENEKQIGKDVTAIESEAILADLTSPISICCSLDNFIFNTFFICCILFRHSSQINIPSW